MAHLGRERVGGVDHMGDGLAFKISLQAHNPTKSAPPLRQRLTKRLGCAPSNGIDRVYSTLRQGVRQGAGLGCAPKQENSHDR